MNAVTTDIIKGSQCEFDHKLGDIKDNHPCGREIIKRQTVGAVGAVNTSALEGRCAKSKDRTSGLNSGPDCLGPSAIRA